MTHCYEDDKLQCSATTQRGVRCTRVGTHNNGGTSGVLCNAHQREYLVKRANDKPIVRSKK